MFFRGSVSQRFSYRSSQLLSLIASLSFHLPFYMSRALPNTYALIGCLLAYGYWLRAGSKARSSDAFKAWWIFGVVALIFRCDLLAFFGPLSLQLLLSGEIGLFDAILYGSVIFASAIMLSSVIDGYLWQRSLDDPWSWLWPESSVFRFNAIDNRSSEWGVQPWHWYLSSAIPRSLNIFLVLVAAALLNMRHPVVALNEELRPSSSKENLSGYTSTNSFDSLASESDLAKASSRPLLSYSMLSLFRQMLRRPSSDNVAAQRHGEVLYYLTPAFIFIAALSFLPHKELRFIYPAGLPALLLAAAAGLDQLLRPDSDSTLLHVLLGGQLQAHDPIKTIRLPLARHTARNIFFFDLLLSAAVMMMLATALLVSLLGWRVSAANYPGGYALQQLVASIPSSCDPARRPRRIHIDVYPAMTGISR
jgi:alpha-1,6-mannosyltransferase